MDNPYSDLGAVPVDPSNPYADLGAVPIKSQSFMSELTDPNSYIQGAENFVGGAKKILGDVSGAASEAIHDPLGTINNIGNAVTYPVTNFITSKINSGLGSNLAQLPQQSGTYAANLGQDINQVVPYAAAMIPAVRLGEAALPLEGILSSGIRNAAIRSGVAGGLSAAQGQNPVSGAVSNAIGEGIAPLANAALSPVKSLANIVASKAEKQSALMTPSGAALNPTIRSPQAAQSLLETLPENHPTSLGQVTNLPWGKEVESMANLVPLSPGLNQAKYGIADTNAAANSILSDLSGGTKPADLNQQILSTISKNEENTRQSMGDDYDQFEKSLEDAGFLVTKRPNLQAAVNSYLGGNSADIAKGISLKNVSLNPSEQTDLQNIANPSNNVATYGEMKGLESQLKDRARQEYSSATPDYNKAAMWNNLAESVRKDFEANAEDMHIGGNIKQSLENINDKWKKNYYDIYQTPEAQKLINGDPNNVYGNITSRANQPLLDSLDQETKHKIYVMGLKNSLKTNENQDPTIDANSLVNRFSKADPNASEIQSNLLSPQMQKRLVSLQNMTSLSNDARKSINNESSMREILKGSGFVAAAKILGNLALPLAALPVISHSITKRMTNPEAILRYSQGKNPYDINQYPGNIIRGVTPIGIKNQNQ